MSKTRSKIYTKVLQFIANRVDINDLVFMLSEKAVNERLRSFQGSSENLLGNKKVRYLVDFSLDESGVQ